MDDEKNVTEQRIQWHPAFYAGLQIEFREEKEEFIFENEYQIGTKPKAVDVLVIKKNDTYRVQKKIGRFFRKYNLIEYKAPGDYLSIDDFYKVCSYAGFFKANSGNVNEINYDEITITMISYSKPREMIRLLKEEKRYRIREEEQGIYYIEGGMFPAQLIVTKLLSEKENFWLHNLTNKLETKEKVYKEYWKHKDEKLYKSVMNVIVKANKELFEKEESEVCQALFEIYKESLMKMAVDEVKEKVSREVREEVSREVREEVSREVREEMLKELMEKQKQSILNLVKISQLTLEQAFDVLMIPEEERKLYNLG